MNNTISIFPYLYKYKIRKGYIYYYHRKHTNKLIWHVTRYYKNTDIKKTLKIYLDNLPF